MISDKKLEKIEKILGEEKLAELNGLAEIELKSKIVAAEIAMKEATEELESNPIFIELKENLKALSSGLKEVKKHQNAQIAYILHLIEERGVSHE